MRQFEIGDYVIGRCVYDKEDLVGRISRFGSANRNVVWIKLTKPIRDHAIGTEYSNFVRNVRFAHQQENFETIKEYLEIK